MRGQLFLLALLWVTPAGLALTIVARSTRRGRYPWWPALLGCPGVFIAFTMRRKAAGNPRHSAEWRRYYTHLRQCPGFGCSGDSPASECPAGSALYRDYERVRERLDDHHRAFPPSPPSRRLRRIGWALFAVGLIAVTAILVAPGTWQICDVAGTPDDFGQPILLAVPLPFGCL